MRPGSVPWVLMVVVLFTSAMAPRVRGDVVHLKGGTKLEGEVRDLGETLEVTRFSMQVTLRKSDVERVEKVASPYEEYLSKAKDPKLDTAAGRFAFAQWCKEKGWKDRYEEETRRCLALDPDYLPARQALGFEKYQGQWMTPDQIRFEEGFVRYEDRWVRPERADLLKQRDEERERWKVVNRAMEHFVARMSTGDPAARATVYEEMIAYGRQHGVLNVENLAQQTREYYDDRDRVQALIESQYVTLEVHAGNAELTQPIRTLPIVQMFDIFGILHTVSIQLPALGYTGAHTTVIVPAGSGS